MAGPTEVQRALLAANLNFYRAFESLEAERMGDVWLKESYVSCTHPGWARIVGWAAVTKSWENIFINTLGVSIKIRDEIARISGDVGWVTCTEELETRLYDGISHGSVEATNVFEQRGGVWLLIHHHGSPLVRDRSPDDDPRLH